MKRLLIIDDEELIIKSIELILEDYGIDVTGFSNPKEGLKSALEDDFDLILVDVRMPELDGAMITKEIMEQKPNSKIMVITGFPQDPLSQAALEYGAFNLLKKPFEIVKILNFLNDEDT